MIPLVDIARQNKFLLPKVQRRIISVIKKGDFILGSEVAEFEETFATYCGTKYSVGVASGTDAILLACRALDLAPGDEVIVPANTFMSTILPIVYLGAKPVLVDIDPETYSIDKTKIEKAISKKTKVIMPVHLYGYPADLTAIKKIASKHNLTIVEDACQAHGSLYEGKKVGGLTDIACFSFYPGKNLGAFGDAGAITTNDKKISEKLKILRNIGQSQKYYHVEKGYNSRLDTIQAVVLFEKLKYLDKWNSLRRVHAALYTKLLSTTSMITPIERNGSASNYHLYVVRLKRRDDLLEYLKEKGIHAGIHYPIPIHLQECMKDLGYKKGDFPITERYADEILSLPIFPELKKSEISYIVDSIKKFYEIEK